MICLLFITEKIYFIKEIKKRNQKQILRFICQSEKYSDSVKKKKKVAMGGGGGNYLDKV